MNIKELSDACVKHEVDKLNEQWNLPIGRELHGDVTTTESKVWAFKLAENTKNKMLVKSNIFFILSKN